MKSSSSERNPKFNEQLTAWDRMGHLNPVLTKLATSSKDSSLQENSLTNGLPAGWTRTTLVIREGRLEKLKALAYWERTQIKDIIEELVENFVSAREIRPIPKEKKKLLK